MNKKAQIATVVAVILGLFLIVVTAIKFDWVGMVVRGDTIINFGDNKKPVKEETNKPNNDQIIEEEPTETTDDYIYFSCTKTQTNNDVSLVDTYSYTFYNNNLSSSEQNVVISYIYSESKETFDKLVKPYSDLVISNVENKTITSSEQLLENNYNYYELINFESETFENDVVDKTINPNSTFEEIKNYYENLNYSCTQS